jgi:type I restriction enzyme S subunit
MSEWEEIVLGDLIKEGQADLQTGPFGTMLSASEYRDSGVPVIAVQDIGENVLRHEKLVFVSNETAERLNKYRVKKDDIIFGRKGAVDRRALVKGAEQGWVQGSDCIRLRLRGCFEPRFVSYQFGTDAYKNWMMQFSTGATMPSLNQDVLKLLPILCPPLSIQRAIAEVLSSLDDKIDLLTRQNVTLEALAQTYFRQWFVEEAKNDWEEKKLGIFSPVITGKRDANFSTEDGQYPFFTCSQATLAAPNYSFEGAAIILAGNGDFNVKRYRGKFEAYQRTYVLIPYEPKYYNWIYLLMSTRLEDLTAGYHGSVINYLTKDMITDFCFQFPSMNIDAQLNQLDILFEKIDSNSRQIFTLQKLRDTLLPKLISGEVRVK